jgi:hypothetical protein
MRSQGIGEVESRERREKTCDCEEEEDTERGKAPCPFVANR